MKITACNLVDCDLLRRATNSKTQYIFVGAPWNILKAGIAGRFLSLDKERQEGRVKCIYLGIGNGRIGFTNYQGPLEALDHKAYRHVTSSPFGFAYFKGRGGVRHQTTFAGDYMRMTYRSHYKTKKYVFIGDDFDIELGIHQFLQENPPLAITLYKPGAEHPSCWRMVNSKVVCELVSAADSSHTIEVVALDLVSNEQMRALMQASIPFIGVSGVMTMIEGLSLNKMVLTIHLQSNQIFFDDYSDFLYQEAKPIGKGAQFFNLSRQLLWDRNVGLSTAAMASIVTELDDEKSCKAFTSISSRVAATNATHGICEALGIPLDVKHGGEVSNSVLKEVATVELNTSPVAADSGAVMLVTVHEDSKKVVLK